MFQKSILYILLTCLNSAIFLTYGQNDTTLIREVEVIKAYKPSISDANKISSMPKIEDVEHEKPNFSYSIFSQPVFNTFSVNTLKAATFASEPKEDTGLGLIRGGIGNYKRPYGELFFNSKDIRNTVFGLHGKHLSSHGTLTLEGGDQVKAPFSDNEAEMYVKYFSRNSVFSVNLDFNHNGFNYYGYPVNPIPDLLKEDDQQINYLGLRQTFSKAGININLENISSGRKDFTFDFDFLYHYFITKTEQNEHFGKFTADVKKAYDKGFGFLNAGVIFINTEKIFNRYLMAQGEDRQIWLTAQPSYRLGGNVANITLGFKSWFVLDNSTDAIAKIAPTIRANLVPVKEIINIFAGVDGNYMPNNYSKIAYENPYVDPEHHVRNTFERFHFFGGFDGKLATKTNFKIQADYTMIKDKPLYYLFEYSYSDSQPEMFIVDNDFDIIYDDMDILKFNLEIFHSSFEKINLLLSGNYYVYTMKKREEPWNLPDWDAKLSLGYQISDQLSMSTDMLFTGQRKTLIFSYPGKDPRPLSINELLQLENLHKKSYNLPTIFDLNFNANYRITNKFSIFAQFNNFAFRKYQKWLGYPVQSFNILGGLSYAF